MKKRLKHISLMLSMWVYNIINRRYKNAVTYEPKKIFCSYKCSKCGEINKFCYCTDGIVINKKAKRRMSKKMNRLIRDTAGGNYRKFKTDYKCRYCGHQEAWGKLGKGYKFKKILVLLEAVEAASFFWGLICILIFYICPGIWFLLPLVGLFVAIFRQQGMFMDMLMGYLRFYGWSTLKSLFIINIIYAAFGLVMEIRYRKIMSSIKDKSTLPKLADTKKLLDDHVEELLNQ